MLDNTMIILKLSLQGEHTFQSQTIIVKSILLFPFSRWAVQVGVKDHHNMANMYWLQNTKVRWLIILGSGLCNLINHSARNPNLLRSAAGLAHFKSVMNATLSVPFLSMRRKQESESVQLENNRERYNDYCIQFPGKRWINNSQSTPTPPAPRPILDPWQIPAS